MYWLFTYLAYVQVLPFIWLYLYPIKWMNSSAHYKLLFVPAWIIFYVGISPILLKSLNVTLFNEYLTFYYGTIVLLTYVVGLVKGWKFTEALAFSFLFTFLSSLFWEFPLHLRDILFEKGITLNIILQMTHALALYPLYKKFYLKDWKKLSYLILASFILTEAMTYFRLNLIMSGILCSQLLFLNRIICTSILVYIFFSPKILKKKDGVFLEMVTSHFA